MNVSHDILKDENLRHVMRTLRMRHDVYMVGGCVRDALAGLPVSDVDLATSATPDEVLEVFDGTEFLLLDTGVEHGTWTVLHNGASFEVTSYRKDVSTDGRRAVVDFSTDIEDDAQRRDFTMNALYMDYEGRVLDPTGEGVDDLMRRTVRFVGSARNRCKEDYLRILRLFRFHAKYGKGPMDSHAYWAASDLYEGLESISGERIWSELKKMLHVHDPVDSLTEMKRSGVLDKVLPDHDNVANVADVCRVEREASMAPSWERRYAALMGYKPHTMSLPHSNKEEKHVAQISWATKHTDAVAAFLLKDRSMALDAHVLRQAKARQGWIGGPWEEIHRGITADLPVTAQDYMDLGVEPGPRLGNKLKEAKEFFVASNLTASKYSLLRKTMV